MRNIQECVRYGPRDVECCQCGENAYDHDPHEIECGQCGNTVIFGYGPTPKTCIHCDWWK